MTAITFDDIAKKTIEIINSNPDFNYHEFRKKQLEITEEIHWTKLACVYFDEDNEPSCVFGQVLAALNIPYDAEWENTDITSVLTDWLGLTLSIDERCWLAEIQQGQDRKLNWGEALASANEAYPQVTAAL